MEDIDERDEMLEQLIKVQEKLPMAEWRKDPAKIGQLFIEYLDGSYDIGYEGFDAKDLEVLTRLFEDFSAFVEAV